MNPEDSHPLCLECGLCCNGVLFADVELQDVDNVARLQSTGLPLISISRARGGRDREAATEPAARRFKFLQPCPLFENCRCGAYEDRPDHCRRFECLLLREVRAGRVSTPAALQTIRRARKSADLVRALLRELGDTKEQAALSVRFRRMKQRVESKPVDEETAERFGRLSLAVHELNLLLSSAFYPHL